MTSRPVDAALTALYPVAVLLGIVLMPFALLVHRLGLSVPFDNLLDRITAAYASS